MQKPFLGHFKNGFLSVLVFIAAAGWLYIIYNQNRAKDPMEIVKKNFVFYPEYSHGVWHETQCTQADKKKCRDVTYTVPVKGCGPVNFSWRVFPGEDADATWSYTGTTPRINESKYPLYAVLNMDSRLIDPPGAGDPLPETCQLR